MAGLNCNRTSIEESNKKIKAARQVVKREIGGLRIESRINEITQGNDVITNKRKFSVTINEHFTIISKTVNLNYS